MDEQIGVSLSRVRECIESATQDRDSLEFTTTEVIQHYLGRFRSDLGTAAVYSFNAQFGKLLQRNAESLDIVEIDRDVPIRDDHGHETKTSRWQRTAAGH